MKKYLNLLVDPCAAEFTTAPYSSVESGYYVRTKDEISIKQAAQADAQSDCILTFTPSLGYGTSTATGNPNILAAIQAQSGTDMTLKYLGADTATADAISNNFLQTEPVGRYRCISACVKWVPNGKYSDRSGTISCGYFATHSLVKDQAITANEMASIALHSAPNGSENHEVVWMPGTNDGFWTNNNAAWASANYPTPGAQVWFCLRNVDGTATTTAAGVLNGYFEITAVWEWLPAAALSIVQAPRKSLSFTLNDVLSSIDPTRIILHNTGQFDGGNQELTKGYTGKSRVGRGLGASSFNQDAYDQSRGRRGTETFYDPYTGEVKPNPK